MAMYDVVQDTLSKHSAIMGTEIELRFRVPPTLFHTVRKQYAQDRKTIRSVSEMLYCDATDLRCVDGIWQRKRTAQIERLPSPVYSTLVVAVESPAAAPSSTGTYRRIERERWSYTVGDWRVDFTTSSRSSNIEIEYIADVSVLQENARTRGDLCGLMEVLHVVTVCMAFSAFGQARYWAPGTPEMPFVRMDQSACPVPRRQREDLVRLMQRNQPVSLSADVRIVERPLLSLKLDGVRITLVVLSYRGNWYAIAICRRGSAWWVPCLGASSPMVLDCEYMAARREFVVFDIYESHGRLLQTPYSERLHLLRETSLPEFARHTISMKTFYPVCVLSSVWFTQESEKYKSDGVVLHDSSARLDSVARMYKWKPVHTVDLYVGNDGILMDGSYTAFLNTCRDHRHVLTKGDIWECKIVGTSVHPVQRRRDKIRANARHVCREILRAHQSNLQIEDIAVLLAGDGAIARGRGKRART